MFKKWIVAGMAVMAVAVQAQSVFYNGRPLSFGNDRPYTRGEVLMLPARDTMSRVGGALSRNGNGMRIRLTWNRNAADYRQGETTFLLNGRKMDMRTRSEERGGVLYLPFAIFSNLTDHRLTRGGGSPTPPPHGGGRIYFDRLPVGGHMAAPYLKGGIWMVPFRDFGSAIGARTDRSADGLRVWITFAGNKVEYDKGHIWFRLNGNRRNLRVVSDNRGDVLFVPVELFIAVSNGRVAVR